MEDERLSGGDALPGRYEVGEWLGRGGMATVRRAFDRQLERSVAIKIFASWNAGDEARRRTEASILARLSHPNLVALYDAHLASDGDRTPSFLVMELVDGSDLSQRLEEGPLPAGEVVDILVGIAEALVVVHGAGMVHRDLKPANILLGPSVVPGGPATIKLADFGIAHLIGSERLTTAGTVIGTAGYLSPEQATGSEPGPGADIYSLGLVVLEALTGVREYPGTPIEAVTARAVRDPRIPRSLREDWRGLLATMTARDPALRPSAVEVAVMAREIAPQLAGWTPPVPGVPEAVADTGPTVAMDARFAPAPAVAAVTAQTGHAPAVGGDVPHRRRRRFIGMGVAGASAAVVALTLGLGSMAAPAEKPESVPTSPRPVPTVTPAPAAVVDAGATAQTDPGTQQQTSQQPAPAPAPAHAPPPAPAPKPAKQDNPNKGPGHHGDKSGKG